MRADISAVTVSGVSSGGFMAVQMHVAHSATVRGAAAIAGGPYYCAMDNIWTAYFNCMSPGRWTPLPSLSVLKAATDRFAQAKLIDATSNLASARVWLFSGTQDHTVAPAVVQALQAFYALYGVRAVLVDDQPAGHGMVTLDAGNYDAAGELLKHLLGPLQPPAREGPLREFDQGYLYVPGACERERCRVHVAFHGCRQSGERFPREAGYNRWAETNRLIVLYPQVKASLFNPNGCWDWWGYTGATYATRDGAQIRAVWEMLERLSASPK